MIFATTDSQYVRIWALVSLARSIVNGDIAELVAESLGSPPQ